jgi:hypothetical protein
LQCFPKKKKLFAFFEVFFICSLKKKKRKKKGQNTTTAIAVFLKIYTANAVIYNSRNTAITVIKNKLFKQRFTY